MASPAVLDFETLLAPIPGDNPAGVYLRDADRNRYDAIRAGYRQGRAAEERADPATESVAQAGMNDWRKVKSDVISALSEQTKDLDLCTFLIEALCRTDGSAGLRDGFRLVRELVEQYWDHLYPRPEEGEEVDNRVLILSGLNGTSEKAGTLPPAIARLPLAIPTGGAMVSFADYHDALARGKKNPDGPDQIDPIRDAIKTTSGTTLRLLRDDLAAAAAEFRAMTEALDQKCGGRAPGSSQIGRELEQCQDILQALAGDMLVEADASAEGDGGGEARGDGGGGGGGGGSVKGREAALKTLLEVASFFDRTEPHSVIPHALRQVVRWGRMSLPQLLMELIPDQASRDAMFKQVGIQPPEEASSSS
jgi:type VI secretion system protein ImpA